MFFLDIFLKIENHARVILYLTKLVTIYSWWWVHLWKPLVL